jgi:hypothetical protein
MFDLLQVLVDGKGRKIGCARSEATTRLKADKNRCTAF